MINGVSAAAGVIGKQLTILSMNVGIWSSIGLFKQGPARPPPWHTTGTRNTLEYSFWQAQRRYRQLHCTENVAPAFATRFGPWTSQFLCWAT